MKSFRVFPVTSLLDSDFYKFTMGQFVFLNFPNVEVEFELINRSRAPLAYHIREADLRATLTALRTLRLTQSELSYLRGLRNGEGPLFREEYLDFLSGLSLPRYTLKRDGDTYRLSCRGPWPLVMMWEIPALATVNELYYRGLCEGRQDECITVGDKLLREKIALLRTVPNLSFSDFGTRRRYSRAWQGHVLETLVREIPSQLQGTSNVMYAMRYGLRPIGTSAHELPMVLAALAFAKNTPGVSDTGVLESVHQYIFEHWFELYGDSLSIALTDTFGSDFFFRTAPRWIAEQWRGTRQDSGNPFRYGEEAIRWYERHGIDPSKKVVVWSDQLDVALMITILEQFYGRIGVGFGIGTNLTNDCGVKAISLVMKAMRANGHDTVKLSDNRAKATGPQNTVDRYSAAAGYVSTLYEECRS
ncbi:MAG: nicotinate phosphoribosyltransferase [Patescibacteria group bacterium]|nr:nicotinate phosphoribosyltransferase [Patescibacteria group bacterium]MDE2438169.1 nicotinate phosphoribosyltransferase [Patescibacteria group bacterium]